MNKILFVEETESVIDPITEHNLEKNIVYKDTVFDNGMVLYIDKYNL